MPPFDLILSFKRPENGEGYIFIKWNNATMMNRMESITPMRINTAMDVFLKK
jgi:hypothetical protein